MESFKNTHRGFRFLVPRSPFSILMVFRDLPILPELPG
jgi:hypothetical protein